MLHVVLNTKTSSREAGINQTKAMTTETKKALAAGKVVNIQGKIFPNIKALKRFNKKINRSTGYEGSMASFACLDIGKFQFTIIAPNAKSVALVWDALNKNSGSALKMDLSACYRVLIVGANGDKINTETKNHEHTRPIPSRHIHQQTHHLCYKHEKLRQAIERPSHRGRARFL